MQVQHKITHEHKEDGSLTAEGWKTVFVMPNVGRRPFRVSARRSAALTQVVKVPRLHLLLSLRRAESCPQRGGAESNHAPLPPL